MNLNIFESTFASFKAKPWIPRKRQQDSNCPGSCQAQLNGSFWLANQRYWIYKCSCCGARQIKPCQKGSASFNWGGNYD